MGGYQEHLVGAWYVRTNKVRLGAPGVWKRVIEEYQSPQLNPQLSLAHYASYLSHEELLEIHDRKKAEMEEKVVFERVK